MNSLQYSRDDLLWFSVSVLRLYHEQWPPDLRVKVLQYRGERLAHVAVVTDHADGARRVLCQMLVDEGFLEAKRVSRR